LAPGPGNDCINLKIPPQMPNRLENPPRKVDAAMQKPTHEFDPQHQRAQGFLCLFGPLVMGLGIVLAVIGMFSFFSSLRSFQPPTYLWGVMVGLPLLGVGAGLANFGRDGEILRDLAEEVSPVAKAPFNTTAGAARHGVETLAQDVERGLTTTMNGDSLSESETILCGRCLAANPVAAKFCNQCGTSLLIQTCQGCGASITPTARFCTECGKLVG
jgi:ribosomal protein L40E